MKKIKILFFLAGLMGSGYASAYDLLYKVKLRASNTDDSSAFGGVDVGDVFSGVLGADSSSLAAQADGYSDTTITAATPDDGIDFMFNFVVGDHDYNFSYNAGRDYIDNPDYGFAETTLYVNSDALASFPANVTEIVGFSIDQPGDADSFELSIDTTSNTWSAYDPLTGYGVNGSVSISQVPLPAAAWLFTAGLAGLRLGLKNKQAV